MARTRRKIAVSQATTPIPMGAAKYNTALYIRLSIMDNGKKGGESILNQQELLEQYVSKHPELTLKETFIEMMFLSLIQNPMNVDRELLTHELIFKSLNAGR